MPGLRDIQTLPLILCGPLLRRVERDQTSVWLALREAADVTLTVLSEDGRSLLRHTGRTRRIGKHLHVVLVTATPIGEEELAPGTRYEYDLSFSVGGRTAGLRDPGILTNGAYQVDITYDGAERPSFVTPPANLDDLHILHASCRKPHGPAKDALAAADDLVARTPAPARPQQLFLTGDQIYADDVAAPLLHLILSRQESVFGWQERLPGGRYDDELRPGMRADLVARLAGFTTGEGDSHLVGFTEFALMYLLVWSDVLWPTQLPDEAAFESLYGTKAPSGYMEQRKALHALRRNDLKRVRRVLANMPTYMIFDDHEITDDWNLDLSWVEDVYRSPLGPRIIRNGLLAYAVFQHWGNVPASPDVDRMLGAVETWAQAEEQIDTQPLEADDTDAAVSAAVALPHTTVDGENFCRPLRTTLQFPCEGAIRWDYTVEGPAHRVVVLDTRTRRAYPTKLTTELIQQGPHGMDLELAPLTQSTGDPRLVILVSPVPVADPVGIKRLHRVAAHLLPNHMVDYEPWAANLAAFNKLLQSLARYGRGVILSGDVHYGCTIAIEYADRTVSPAHLVQCTASPSKNSNLGAGGMRSSTDAEKHAYTGTLTPFKLTPMATQDAPGLLGASAPEIATTFTCLSIEGTSGRRQLCFDNHFGAVTLRRTDGAFRLSHTLHRSDGSTLRYDASLGEPTSV